MVGQPKAPPRQLRLEDAVFLDQVFDDVLLVAIDPSGEGHEQHLQGVGIGRHGPIVPCLIPDPVTGSGPAEFSDSTGIASGTSPSWSRSWVMLQKVRRISRLCRRWVGHRGHRRSRIVH